MRFLVDAQLPRRFAHRLREAGHDALHTLDLPGQNATPDAEITRLADAERRVIVTKDADFVTGHLVRRAPARLWLVSTGNLSNAALDALVLPHLGAVVGALADGAFVELTPRALIVHR